MFARLRQFSDMGTAKVLFSDCLDQSIQASSSSAAAGVEVEKLGFD